MRPGGSTSGRDSPTWAPLILCVALTLGGILLAAVRPAAVEEYLETLLVDYRFRLRNRVSPPRPPDEVVIVAVDERSLAEHGRWPWTRALQARLIERILADDPGVVAVDILFPEPESEEADAALADVLARAGERVVVALGLEVEPGKVAEEEIDDVLFDQAVPVVKGLSDLQPVRASRALLPPPPIRDAARYGHVYSLPDRDGKTRWEGLYLEYGGEYFLSLAVQAARVMSGVTPGAVSIIGGEGLDLGGLRIPSDDYGRLHVNYAGREGTVPYVSATDVLAGLTPPGTFRGKAVFLGTSAIATYDLMSTPFSANAPGVEKNATVCMNILRRDFIRRAPRVVDLLVVLLSGFAVGLCCSRLPAPRALVFSTLVLLLLLAGNQAAFMLFGIRSGLAYPLFTVLLAGGATFSFRFLVAEKRARAIRRLFSSYVTERVVGELVKRPDLAKLGGERKEVTLLFSDIRGFTTFSERNEPEYVVSMLNEYLAAMTDVVFHWEGTLDKFVGDEIVVFWGAPLPQEDHAERAVRCALHMTAKLQELQAKWRQDGRDVLDHGIGVNTGEVLVGNIGAEGKKMDYTVIGDHVNLGARTEGLTRKFDCHIVLTEFTVRRVQPLLDSSAFGHMELRALETVTVAGRRQTVQVFELADTDTGSVDT